ncbi:ArdC family protein [Bacillus cereus]|nr:ArdC family protein [Bacillus cereus]WJE22415.1 ArdC family protein [Bacillus cereus]
MNVYEIVTNTIMEKLEKGVVPWRKEWVSGQLGYTKTI